jgi:hypothetical protein
MSRSNPFIIVTCDCCGDTVEVSLTPLARESYDERDVEAHLEGVGWIPEPDEDFCSTECHKRHLDAETSPKCESCGRALGPERS